MKSKASMALKMPRAKEKARPPPPEKHSAVETGLGNLGVVACSLRNKVLRAYFGQ